MKILSIINPKSGSLNLSDVKQNLTNAAGVEGFDIFLSATPAEAVARLVDYSSQNYSALVICGGDGTINPLLPMLAELKLPFWIYPTGTANDFASAIGHSQKLPDFKNQKSHSTKAVDLIHIGSKFVFVTMGGFGFPVEVCRKTNRMKQSHPLVRDRVRKAGPVLYPLTGLVLMLMKQPENLKFRLHTEAQSVVIDPWCLYFANQPFFAGNLTVVSDADSSDGVLDILYLNNRNRRERVASLAALHRKNTPPKAELFREKRFVLENLTNMPVECFVDGEIGLIEEKNIEVWVDHGALRPIDPSK